MLLSLGVACDTATETGTGAKEAAQKAVSPTLLSPSVSQMTLGPVESWAGAGSLDKCSQLQGPERSSKATFLGHQMICPRAEAL